MRRGHIDAGANYVDFGGFVEVDRLPPHGVSFTMRAALPPPISPVISRFRLL